MEEYDYVVLGGGSAGCVVASRLSEDPAVTVCLIEAGGEGKDTLIRVPLGFAIMPCVTSNTINAPVIMIGEKCAAMMRSEKSD